VDEERHSDRPTMPRVVDESLLGLSTERGAAGQREAPDAVMSGATVRARASDFRALLEAERRLADTASSGVRAMAPVVIATNEHDAVDVAPPQKPDHVEAPGFARVTTSNDPVPETAVAVTGSAYLSPGDVVAHESPARPRLRSRSRRFVAAGVFTLVIVGALELLSIAASRRGLLRFPQVLELKR